MGQLLIEGGLIGREDLEKALAFQASYGGRLGSILVRMGAVGEDPLLALLARQLDLPVLEHQEIPTEIRAFLAAIESSGLASEWWLDQEALAWETGDGRIHLMARDPLKSSLQEVVGRAFAGRTLTWWLARTQDLDRTLDQVRRRITQDESRPGDDIQHLKELAEEAPVVELVSNTLAQAFNEGASDIHIEPSERSFAIRFRLDGVLQNRLTLPRERFDAVASRIKLISGIDIAERRLPQDGRISVRLSGQEIDVRVSSVPGVWGESIVLRLLPKERQAFRLDKLGMEDDYLERYRGWLAEPHGIILVTGPTGSGKSTTLYATLESINDGKEKILTVEDPVEYNVPGISQIQVHADIGYTFARALRAILRQDPDTIMIGEIRDGETAQIAVQASLTGHTVFSTLHTNDAIGAFTRLIDMGVEPFLVVSSVRAVIAQRLVRLVCRSCAEPEPASEEAARLIVDLQRRFPDLLKGPSGWRHGRGCRACQGTGYKGRMAIYEMASVTPDLHEAILTRAPTQELQRIAGKHGYRTLREDGMIKAWRGDTSLEEVLRVTGLAE
ncbi:MAG: type II/IV secretion system protein [Chloroflexota bacterium]|nr:MAG: type II/IV secretion system protein [Chloroflexota bacterium]